MKPNSLLIIREHDVKDNYMPIFLDFVHAFYMTINSNEETIENFTNNYKNGNFANYKSLDEWVSILQTIGNFKLIKVINTNDMFNSGYIIIQKV
jgi:hypothetical protein